MLSYPIEIEATSMDLSSILGDTSFYELNEADHENDAVYSDVKGIERIIDYPFVVLSKDQTVAEGAYSFVPYTNSGFAIQVKGKSNNSGANVELGTKASTKYQALNAKYEGNGYYSTAYNIYALILLISSYSIPTAISKLISEKIALKQYNNAQKILKCAFIYVCVMGGGAAIVAALSALGPGGIIGGIVTLGLIGLIAHGLTEYGVEKISCALIKELLKKGETKESILEKIEKYPISKSLKRHLKEVVTSY